MAERLSVLQEENAADGMSFSAKRGVAFSPLIFGDKDETSHVRAGPLGNTGVVLFFGAFVTAFLAAWAVLLKVPGAENVIAPAVIVAVVGAVLIGVDGSR